MPFSCIPSVQNRLALLFCTEWHLFYQTVGRKQLGELVAHCEQFTSIFVIGYFLDTSIEMCNCLFCYFMDLEDVDRLCGEMRAYLIFAHSGNLNQLGVDWSHVKDGD